MEVLLTLSNITQMPLYKAASPVGVTESLIARKLLESGKRIGVEFSEEDNEKDGKYAGAFVKEPIRGYHQGVAAFDFASLYPSIMRQFNISPDSFIEKVKPIEVEAKREDKEVIVCDNGVVYRKEDSMLRMILGDLYGQRKDYKSLSYDYFTKAENIKRHLKKL
jgi:DNA polymerase elongation subunit (family B)